MGFCVICGKEFVDLSKAHTKKYCSGACKYRARLHPSTKRKPRANTSTGERKTYKPSYSDGWVIPELCKKCFYRRSFNTGNFIREVIADWSDTYCAYLEIEDELRGCEPDNNCIRFKEREENNNG